MQACGALKGLVAHRRKSSLFPITGNNAATLDMDGRKIGASGCQSIAQQLAPGGRLASVQVLDLRNCHITRSEHQLQAKQEGIESEADSDTDKDALTEQNTNTEGTGELRPGPTLNRVSVH